MGVPKDVPDAAAGTPSPVSPIEQHTVNRDTGTPAMRKLPGARLQTSRTESVTQLPGLLLIVGFIFISYYPLARLMRLSYRN